MLPALPMDSALDQALGLLREDRTDEARFVLSRLVEEQPELERARELLALVAREERPVVVTSPCPDYDATELAWFQGNRRVARRISLTLPPRSVHRPWLWALGLVALLGVEGAATAAWISDEPAQRSLPTARSPPPVPVAAPAVAALVRQPVAAPAIVANGARPKSKRHRGR